MANTPDVRIRLSAEGVQEVVNALRQVQQQARQAGQAAQNANGGFASLTGGVTSLKGVLETMAGAFGALKVAEFVKDAYDGVAALAKLSESTGTSVESLSRMQYAAAQAGVTNEEFVDSYKELNQRIGEASTGSGDAADAFKAMGISLKDTKGQLKPTAQLFRELSDKFATYKDGAAKAALGAMLLGDEGVKMIKVLSQGGAGLDDMAKKAEDAGAVLSDKTAKGALELNQTVATMKENLAGLARTGFGPVLSVLNEFIQKLKDAKSTGASWFGAYTSASAATIGQYFGKGTSDVVGYRTELNKAAEDVGRLKSILAKGSVNPLFLSNTNQVLIAAEANFKRLHDAAAAPVKVAATPEKKDAPLPKGAADAEAAKAAAAALALAKAKSDAEKALGQQQMALAKAQLSQTAQAYDEAYSKGLVDLAGYSAARIAIIEQQNEAELAAARASLSAAENLPAKDKAEEERRSLAIAQAKSEVTQREIEGTLNLAQAHAKFGDELKQLNDERDQYTRQTLEETGKTREAAVMALDAEIKKYDELLAKLGTVGDERARLTGDMKTRGTAKIDFGDQETQADNANFAADKQKAAIERDLAQGRVWAYQAEEQQLQVERDRLAVLTDISVRMTEAAKVSGDPALQRKAAETAEAVLELSSATNTFGLALGKFKKTFEENLSVDLNAMLDSIVDGTASAKDAVKAFVASMVDSFRKQAQDLLVQEAIKPILSLFGGTTGLYQRAATSQMTAADTQNSSSSKFKTAVSKFEMAVDKLLGAGAGSELSTLLDKMGADQVSRGLGLSSQAQSMSLFPSTSELSKFFGSVADDSKNNGDYGAVSLAPWAKEAASAASSAAMSSQAVASSAAAVDATVDNFGGTVSGLFGDMKSLFSGGSSSAGGDGVGMFAQMFDMFGSFATGGHVAGAGTGTSDSIPAWLSNGEFVMRAAVVQQPGMRQALETMNAGGRMPSLRTHNYGTSRFADGGLVGTLAQANTGGGNSTLEIGLDDGLIIKTLATHAGKTAIVKAMGSQRRAARQMGYL